MKVGVLLFAWQRHLDESAIVSFFVNEHGKSIYVLLQYTGKIRRGFGLLGESPNSWDEPPWRYSLQKEKRRRLEERCGSSLLEAMQEKLQEVQTQSRANEGWGKAFSLYDLPLWQHLAQEQTIGLSRCEVGTDKKNPEACTPPSFSFASHGFQDRDGATKLRCRYADEEEKNVIAANPAQMRCCIDEGVGSCSY